MPPVKKLHSVRLFSSKQGFPAKVIFGPALLLSQAFTGGWGGGEGEVGFSMKKLVALCSPAHWGENLGNRWILGTDTIRILSHNRKRGKTRWSRTLLLLHQCICYWNINATASTGWILHEFSISSAPILVHTSSAFIRPISWNMSNGVDGIYPFSQRAHIFSCHCQSVCFQSISDIDLQWLAAVWNVNIWN